MAHRADQADDINFYPTAPWAARAGAEVIRLFDPVAKSAYEPACGPGMMAHGLRDYFDIVHASDAYLYGGHVVHDFIGSAPSPFAADWIVTNPPFAPAEAFIRRAYAEARRGVAMLLRTGVLEGQRRHGLLYGDCPLTAVAPFSERLPIVKGRYDPEITSAAFYSWFIWVKPALRPTRLMARVGGVYRPAVIDIPPGTAARLTRDSDRRFAVGRGICR